MLANKVRVGLLLTASLWISCGDDVEYRPVDALPLGPKVAACLKEIHGLLPQGRAGRACIYFPGGKCGVSAPLDYGEDSLKYSPDAGGWRSTCPGPLGEKEADFFANAGDRVPVNIYILVDEANKDAICPTTEPLAGQKCNDSLDDALRDLDYADEVPGCIGVLSTELAVDKEKYGLIFADFEPVLKYSGFLQLEAGAWSPPGPVCSAQTEIAPDNQSCDSEVASCVRTNFRVEKAGRGPGALSYEVKKLGAFSCDEGACEEVLPQGLSVDIEIAAQGRGVLAKVDSADTTCDREFYTDTTTTTQFTCTATVGRTDPVVASFGYPLTILVEGRGTVTRVPHHGSSSVCAADSVCRDIYENAEQVILTPANAPWPFLRWTGCVGDRGPCMVSMTEPRVVQALFGQGVEITADLPGTVAITTSTNERASCEFTATERTCSRTFDAPASGNLRLTLSPTGTGEGPREAQVGTVFGAWKNCTSVSGRDCIVELPTNNPFIQVGLSFANEVQVNVVPPSAAPAATVRFPMGAQECAPVGANCRAFAAGAMATLEAVGTEDWGHLAWTGSCFGQGAECVWQNNSPEQLTVEFGRPLELEVFGSGAVAAQAVRLGNAPRSLFNCRPGATCRAVVPHEWNVELAASPDSGYEVMRWEKSGSSTFCDMQEPQPGRECTVQGLASRQRIAARFGRALTVSVGLVNARGSTSLGLPANDVGADPLGPCGRMGSAASGDCVGIFEDNATVTLTRVVPSGWAVRWAGDCTTDPCVLTMNGPKTVSLNPGRIVTPAVGTGAGSGTVNVAGCTAPPCILDDGATATINAVPATGWDIIGWTGCTPVPNNLLQCTLTVGAANNPRAFFGRPVQLTGDVRGTLSTNAPAGPTGSPVARAVAGCTPTVSPPATCTGVFYDQTVVTLSTQPVTGYERDVFTNCTALPDLRRCTFTAQNNTAQPVVNHGRILNLAITGGGEGEVTGPVSSNTVVDCRATSGDCQGVYADNLLTPPSNSINIALTADANFRAVRSTNCTLSRPTVGATALTDNCNVMVPAIPTPIPNAAVVFSNQAVTVGVTGPGEVTTATGFLNGNGMNACRGDGSGDCRGEFASNQAVVLNLASAPGFQIGAVTGCTLSGTTCTVAQPRTGAVDVTVAFVGLENLTVSILTPGGAVTDNQAAGDRISNCGQNGSGDCAAAYFTGTNVILNITPQAGWETLDAIGCNLSANLRQCSFTVGQPSVSQITIRFGRSVSLINQVTGNGTINSLSPASANVIDDCRGGTGDCFGVYGDGQLVTLLITPDTGYELMAVTGCAYNPVNRRCTLTPTGAATVQVAFGRQVTVTPGEGGQISTAVVTSQFNLTNCNSGGGTCVGVFPNNAALTLNLSPTAGWQAMSATGCTLNGAGTTCTVTPTAPTAVAINFGRQVTVTPSANGQVDANVPTSQNPIANCRNGSGDCVGVFSNNTLLTLDIVADAGYRATSATGCALAADGLSCALTPTALANVTINFQAFAGLLVNVTTPGGTVVSSSPVSADFIDNCTNAGGDCAASFVNGTVVTLNLSPDPGWEVMRATNCALSVNLRQCTLTFNGSTTVTLEFGRPLTLTMGPNGVVSTAAASGNQITNCEDNTGDCFGVFPNNTALTLNITADTGWRAMSATGCILSANGTSCALTPTGAVSVSINFGRVVTVTNGGGGNVSATVVGSQNPINCGTDCEGVFPNNTALSLSITPDLGYRVMGVTNCTLNVSETACTLTPNGATAVTINFGRQVNVTVNPAGQTSRVSASAGTSNNPIVNCETAAGDCEGVFPNNAALTLNITAATGWQAMSATGCTLNAAGTTCTVTPTAQTPVTITFGRPVTVTTNVNGRVDASVVTSQNPIVNCDNMTGDCVGVFPSGVALNLTITSDAGWRALSATGCTLSADGSTCTLTPNGAVTVTITYGRPLTVQLAGTAQVTTNVGSGADNITCGNGATDCEGVYANNTNVTMTIANIPAGNTVLWSGDAACATGALTCQVNMNQARTVVATIVATRTLTLTIGTGTGARSVAVTPTSVNGFNTCTNTSSPCILIYVQGTLVTLNPQGMNFDDWDGNPPGACGNTDAPCSFTINADTAVTANF